VIVIYEKSLGGPSGSIILPAPRHPVERPIISVPLLSLRRIARRRRFTRPPRPSWPPLPLNASLSGRPRWHQPRRRRLRFLPPPRPPRPPLLLLFAPPSPRAPAATNWRRRSGAPPRRRRARHRRTSACLWRWKGEGLKNPAFLVLGLLIPLVFTPKGVSFLLLEDSRC